MNSRGMDSAHLRDLLGTEEVLQVAQFRIKGAAIGRSGHVPELVEYVAPRGAKVDTQTKNTGTAHLAFEVDDIHAEYARMARWGCDSGASRSPSRPGSTRAASPATSSTRTT